MSFVDINSFFFWSLLLPFLLFLKLQVFTLLHPSYLSSQMTSSTSAASSITAPSSTSVGSLPDSLETIRNLVTPLGRRILHSTNRWLSTCQRWATGPSRAFCGCHWTWRCNAIDPRNKGGNDDGWFCSGWKNWFLSVIDCKRGWGGWWWWWRVMWKLEARRMELLCFWRREWRILQW